MSLFVGAIAVFLGVVLGYFLGKTSTQAQIGFIAESTKGLETRRPVSQPT